MEFINLNNRYVFLNDGCLYQNLTAQEAENLGMEYNDYDDKPDNIYIKLWIPILIILLIIGVVGNILLIIAVRRSQRLKAPIFQLLFAIAFADILMLISFSLTELTRNKFGTKLPQTWQFGSQGCTALIFLQYLPAHVAACLIVVCCWERFYAVCRPHSAIWITSRKMSGIIAITWLLNGGVLAPLIAMTKEVTLKYPPSYGDINGAPLEAQTCYVDMEPDVKKLYFTIMGMLFYGITAIVSVAFLSCTICKAVSVDLENYFIKDDFKNHILKCTAVITGGAVLFALPYRYIYFYKLHTPVNKQDENQAVIFLLGTAFIIFNSAMKPIVYITASSQFRKSMIRALKCCKTDNHAFEQAHGYKLSDRFKFPEGEIIT